MNRVRNNIVLLITNHAASSENYKLLEAMNHTTRERYADMSEMAQRLVKEMSKLQSTCKHPSATDIVIILVG